TPVGNVTINPFIKVAYNTALQGYNRTVRAGEAVTYDASKEYAGLGAGSFDSKDQKWDSNPYDVKAQAVLGITAN
ncbi:cell surface protein, partial [Brachyspira hyodysenteriae]